MGQKATLGQKATNNVAQKRRSDKTLALRQMSILQQRAMGKGVQQIATLMGVHRCTIYRTMKPINAADSEWQDTEKANIKSFLGMTNANIAMNLESGNLEAARLVLKVLGFLTDKLEVTGKIEPDEQQQRFYDNIGKLLKITEGKAVSTEAVKAEVVMNLGCTCPAEHGHDSMLMDPHCPVHGDMEPGRPMPKPVPPGEGETATFTRPASQEEYDKIVEPSKKIKEHGDKEQNENS